jgi:general secretion pathway protein J
MYTGSFCISKKRSGFTLIEILIAIFILTVVISTVYASYTGTFRIVKNTEYSSEIYGMARSALERMSRDLESVAVSKGTVEFVSQPTAIAAADNEIIISFRSNAHLIFDESDAPSGGTTLIIYSLNGGKQDEGYLLTRSDLPSGINDQTDPAKAGFVLCNRVQSLTYQFYDDAGKEYEAWDSHANTQNDKTPTVVAVTLNMINPEDKEHPYKFMTKIYLPMSRGGL